MPISQEQRELRRKYIGASDIPAIMGYSKFSNALKVWESKVNELAEDKETEATRFGNLLEDDLITLAEDYLEQKANSNVSLTHGRMIANLDAVVAIGWKYRNKVQNEPCLVEAKTAGFTGPPMEEWGRGGTDQVPLRVVTQCQHQLHVVNKNGIECNVCWVSFLGGHDGGGHRMYRIIRNEKIGEKIEEVCDFFWAKYVLTNTPPPKFLEWDMPNV